MEMMTYILGIQRIRRRGRDYFVIRDEEGRFRRWIKKLYGVTVGINFVVHRKYFSYKCSVTFDDPNDYDYWVDELVDRVITYVMSYVGYEPSEWWFPGPNIGDLEEFDEITDDLLDMFEDPKCKLEYL